MREIQIAGKKKDKKNGRCIPGNVIRNMYRSIKHLKGVVLEFPVCVQCL